MTPTSTRKPLMCAASTSIPDENWAVFSIDEKTGMQAKSRGSTRPSSANHDQRARQEFEYKRHGTQSVVRRVRMREPAK